MPVTRVRFPSPAPFSFNSLHNCAGKVQENWGVFQIILPEIRANLRTQNYRSQNSTEFYFTILKRIWRLGQAGGAGTFEFSGIIGSARLLKVLRGMPSPAQDTLGAKRSNGLAQPCAAIQSSRWRLAK
jgi:hypothetical protein